jgi:hypothetical protein
MHPARYGLYSRLASIPSAAKHGGVPDGGPRRPAEGRTGGAANASGVNSILTAHLWLGALVCALALLFVWQRRGRRVTLYVATLQIVLGVVLMVQGLRVPWYHAALAVLGWGGYMAANVLGRREGGARTVLAVTIVSSLLVLIAFAVGQHAVKAAGG